MKIGICSGYFQRLHAGHRVYINKAIKTFDVVIIIVNNNVQQKNKYKDFEDIKPVKEIIKEIKEEFPPVVIRISEDKDDTVNKTLKRIRKQCPSAKLYFCKDGDRKKNNIPESKLLAELKIRYKQFHNPKLTSSSDIMGFELI